MAKGYYLSEQDRRDWRADHKRLNAGKSSQKPVARRRRGPKGEGATGQLIPGLLIDTISVGSIAGGGTWTVTAGSQADAIVLLKAVVDSPGSFEPVIEGGSPVKLTGKNGGKTALRGSSAEPVLVWGLRDGTNFIVLHAGFDLRLLPNLNSDDVQIPYHEEGSMAFQLDSEACP